jgi:hypothetical protein
MGVNATLEAIEKTYDETSEKTLKYKDKKRKLFHSDERCDEIQDN